jgi:hypothetical protein
MGIIVAGVIAAAIVIAIAVSTFKSGPQPPDVKFEGFTPDISPAIGAKDGESGTQTIVIRGANLGGRPAIEDTFTFTLYVGIEPTDTREISIRLE